MMEHLAKVDTHFQFLLTLNECNNSNVALRIISEDGRALGTMENLLEDISKVSSKDLDIKKTPPKESNLWLISPAEKDDMMPYFLIESNSEGERKPRIVKGEKGT